MNRRNVCLMAACVLSLLVTACSSTENAKTETTKNGADSVVDIGSTGNNTSENNNTGELTLLTSENSSIVSGNFGCATEQGFYYMPEEFKELSDGVYGKHLMYIDYASAQEIYLCNNAGCKHDSAECMAVFTEEDLKASSSSLLFVWQDYLYVFEQRDESGSSGMNYVGENEETLQEPACLYRMNLDGTNREKVLTFDEGLTLEDCVYGCGDNLYFVTKKVTMENLENGGYYNTASDREMVSVDTSTWKQTTLCKLEEDLRLAESCAGGILCRRTVWNDGTTKKEADEMDTDTWIDAYGKTTEEYLLLNPQDGSTKQLAAVSNANINNGAAQGQKVYLSEQGKSGIRVIGTVTGEESVLIPEESKCNWVWKIFKDSILCDALDDPEAETDNLDHSLYFVDLNTGELHHCTLTNKTLGWDLEIVAETQDSFLVIYDYDAIDIGDGGYEITQEYYGLISKEDLYASRDNYRPIQMVEKGK